MSFLDETEDIAEDGEMPSVMDISPDARARLDQLYAANGLCSVAKPQQIANSAEALGYWYIATPYSKYPYGLEQAWREACRIAAHLMTRGIPVYCPVAESHPVAIYGNLDPVDHELWMYADRPKMDAACGLIVAKLLGWNESKGIAEEIRVFEEAGKPIQYLDWVVSPAHAMPIVPETSNVPDQETIVPTQGTIGKQETILDEAIRITSGERRRDYDSATPNHVRIANLWNAYISGRKAPASPLSPGDVALMMILLKIARAAFTATRDSAVDIAGYARCWAQIAGFESE